MPDAFILSAARTPIGRARKGSLTSVDAYQLAEIAIGAAVERSQIPVADLDDLFLAESLQGGGVIGRNIAVRLGMTDVIVAGGTESASTMPRLAKVAPGAQEPTRWSPQSHPDAPGIPAFDMSVTIGENTARLHHVSREQADGWSARSQARALNAIAKGYFDDEIVTVPINQGQLLFGARA